MIVIRFPNAETQRRALGFLAGRFSFTTRSTGETLVPPDALSALASERIAYSVEGPARFESTRVTSEVSSVTAESLTAVSEEVFERQLDALSAAGPTLPADFSRADIYADRN